MFRHRSDLLCSIVSIRTAVLCRTGSVCSGIGAQPVFHTPHVDEEAASQRITGDAQTGFLIKNSHTPETTSVSGSKTWADADNQDGKRPKTITINLIKNNKKIDTKTVSAVDNWSWNFTNLPKYENGMEIIYSISEEKVADYSTTRDGYNLTNSYTPGQTSVSVSKCWDDNNDQDGKLL